jgi:hypothetical protein
MQGLTILGLNLERGILRDPEKVPGRLVDDECETFSWRMSFLSL